MISFVLTLTDGTGNPFRNYYVPADKILYLEESMCSTIINGREYPEVIVHLVNSEQLRVINDLELLKQRIENALALGSSIMLHKAR